jgi:hypothetical protein
VKKTHRDRSRKLRCETLESRQMLAASAYLSGGVLNVVGTSGDDDIGVYQVGKNIYVEGVDGSWSDKAVKHISINCGDGDDYVQINSYFNGGNRAIKDAITVVGGTGTKQVGVGAYHDIFFNGTGNYVHKNTKGVVSFNGAVANLNQYATATLKKGVLTISATQGADDLNFVQLNGTIYISGVYGSFSAKKVKSVVVFLQDGNDSISLDSIGNGGNQHFNKPITMYSGSGTETVHLANGNDVTMNGGGHALHVTAAGAAYLNGAAVTFNPPPPPPPPPPPSGDWFTTSIQDAAIRSLGSSLYTDSVIDRNDIIAILQSAGDDGGVSGTELSDLQKIVNNSTLFAGLNYVERLAEYVVLGSTANGSYQGQVLGNLVSGASTAHLTNLVNKWFLGLDRPTAGGTYRQFAGQLFVGGVAYTDIRQGQVGDCYFVASLAEAALRSPATITNMFVVNGDGTYTVKFYNGGNAEYVTVDSWLPTNASGNLIYAGMGTNYANAGAELWVALAEKAYVQANQFGWIRPGLPGNGQNAYSGIEGGYIYASLGHVTGQSTIAFTSTATGTGFNTFVAAWNAGELIGFASKVTPTSSSVVGSHAYSVVGYNSSTQTVTLYNPWGPTYAQLTLTWTQIQQNFSYFDRTA